MTRCSRIAATVAAVAVLLIATGGSGAQAARLRRAVRVDARLATAIVTVVNGVRASHGLRLVKPANGLARSARFHASAMGKRGFFDHSGPDGAWQRRLERFYPSAGHNTWSVGENLGWGSSGLSAAGIVRGWLGDAAHRSILLNPMWRQIGIAAVHVSHAPGVYRHRNVTIIAADFGARIG